MKCIILCGGQGTRLREHTEVRPKPMVEIGGRPILWHIMKLYAFHGIHDFVLCLGYKAHVIKEYFLNYKAMNSDFTVKLDESEGISLHGNEAEESWSVTLADTGENTMTGARIARAAKYFDDDDDTFMVTYGDGVSDVNLTTLLEFHRSHGMVATLTGVRQPSRFGELRTEGNKVISFAEKPKNNHGLINGGFFCFQREFLRYLDEAPSCILEAQPLERTAADGNLGVFDHTGFWQCMDTYRDWQSLEGQWQTGEAPWKVWDQQAEKKPPSDVLTGKREGSVNAPQKSIILSSSVSQSTLRPTVKRSSLDGFHSTAEFDGAFRKKSVFVTGHTGFKGSWLSVWLNQLGAKVSGYSLSAPTTPSNFVASGVRRLVDQHFESDIRSRDDLRTALDASDPDVIFHLAAQPLVRESYESPASTFDVNFMGTCNLLEAVRLRAKPCVVVVVTSDKCYENNGGAHAYHEDDAMGGHDPYSASKGAAELLAASYRRSFFSPEKITDHGIKLATARAGNVIGGGDWARDRIVSDIISHLSAGRPVPLRNPGAVRPWQHVLAPLHGYLLLASQMLASDDAELCSAWNFGPNSEGTCCVSDLVDRCCAAWGSGSWKNVGAANQPHEAQMLRLSISKALKLGWHVVWSLDQTVEHTTKWYRKFNEAKGASMLDACLADIRDYSRDMATAALPAAIERLTAA